MDNRNHKLCFAICAVLFAIGCIVGVIAARLLPAGTVVGDYVAAQAEIGGSFSVRFARSLYSVAKFHVIVLFFAFSVLGVAGIPAAVAVRGFLLCFTVAAMLRTFGNSATLLVTALLLPEAIIAVPCLLMLSAHTFVASGDLLRLSLGRAQRSPRPYSGFVKTCAMCGVALIICALIETIVTSSILLRISEYFPT